MPLFFAMVGTLALARTFVLESTLAGALISTKLKILALILIYALVGTIAPAPTSVLMGTLALAPTSARAVGTLTLAPVSA